MAILGKSNFLKKGLELIVIAVSLAAGCGAQNLTDLTYQYRAAGQGSGTTVSPSGTIAFPSSAIGTSSSLTFVIQNSGSANWNLNQVTTSGSAFSLSGSVPTSIPAFGTATIQLAFNPTTAGASSGSLSLTVSSGTVVTPNVEVFFLSGTATAPSFILSYTLNPSGNQTQISGGQTLTLPTVSVGGTSSATFQISNQGTASGTVNVAISPTPGAFSASGLPLLPATLQPQGNVSFTISFQPTVPGAASATLTLTLNGTNVTIPLAAQASAAVLTYQVTSGNTTTSVTPGQTIQIPGTQVGQTSSVSIVVNNTGNAAAQIGSLSLTGAGTVLQVAGAAPTPISLAPQQSTTFLIQFSPTVVGPVTGQLLISGVSFPVSATGLGPQLSLSTQISGIVTQIPSAGTIAFPNTTVGSQTSAVVTMTNSGNQPLTISGIAVQSSQDFTGSGFPQTPLVLQPNATASFNVVFEPVGTGVFTGSLLVAGQTFNLTGSGNAPPSVSGVKFGSVPATATPAQQPSIGLSLTQPYPYDLTGQLTLSFSSAAFVNDPAIQFATGGQTVSFTIPANTTQAIFGTNASSVLFQTGTVAGTITFTPSFLVRTVNVTPTPAPQAAVQVQSTPPFLQNIGIGTTTTTSLSLLITGYSPLRQMSTIQLQFTPAAGATLTTTSLNVDVSSQFNTWYQSTPSQQYGSQFTVTLTILVNGSLSNVKSVTATAANSQGTSAPVSVNLQ